MKLKDWLSREGTNQTEFAEKIGALNEQVCYWVNEKRPVPFWWCPLIEIATSGEVSRQDLRPDDFQQMWPELSHKI